LVDGTSARGGGMILSHRATSTPLPVPDPPGLVMHKLMGPHFLLGPQSPALERVSAPQVALQLGGRVDGAEEEEGTVLAPLLPLCDPKWGA
jgi:hypothetical protein